jgi:hypothetical protein
MLKSHINWHHVLHITYACLHIYFISSLSYLYYVIVFTLYQLGNKDKKKVCTCSVQVQCFDLWCVESRCRTYINGGPTRFSSPGFFNLPLTYHFLPIFFFCCRSSTV